MKTIWDEIVDSIGVSDKDKFAKWLCRHVSCVGCPALDYCTYNTKHNGMLAWLESDADSEYDWQIG